MSARAVADIRPASVTSSLDSRSFTSCLAKGQSARLRGVIRQTLNGESAIRRHYGQGIPTSRIGLLKLVNSFLPPSRVNAVAETGAALGKGYHAIGGSTQLVTDGWAVVVST